MSWNALDEEFDRWAADGREARLWWRDDDAIAPSPALDRLLAVSERHGAPLALAVIPLRADPALARRLGGEPERVAVIQHGARHENHAMPGGPAAELGADRALAAVIAEALEGRRRLANLFGSRFVPVMAPPWNSIDGTVAAALADHGWRGLTGHVGRAQGFEIATPGFVRADASCDPIGWKTGRRFIGEAAALGALLRDLERRRTGILPLRPSTLMTHHLDHDEEGWGFVDRLVGRVAAHGGARWLPTEEVFA